MILQDITKTRTTYPTFHFHAEVLSRCIWGDMGEDSACVDIHVIEQGWSLHYIRTETGEPSAFDEFQCNVIDEYTKELQDEQLYEFLAHHALFPEFELAYSTFSK